MADIDYQENEGADFSKFFDGKNQNPSGEPEQPEETPSHFTVTKRTKTLLIILVILMVALGAVLFLTSSHKKPSIPAGFHFNATPHQPARLEPDKPNAK